MGPNQEFVRHCPRKHFSVPSSSDHFAAKLPTRANEATPEAYLDHPSDVLLCQFRVKKSTVHCVFAHLGPTKFVGYDHDISPRVLRKL